MAVRIFPPIETTKCAGRIGQFGHAHFVVWTLNELAVLHPGIGRNAGATFDDWASNFSNHILLRLDVRRNMHWLPIGIPCESARAFGDRAGPFWLGGPCSAMPGQRRGSIPNSTAVGFEFRRARARFSKDYRSTRTNLGAIYEINMRC
jgi:hypothetical protein